MITPDPEPEPAWTCDGLAGTPRVRMVTTEDRTLATTAGTERVLSVETTALEPGLAQAPEEPKSRLARGIKMRGRVAIDLTRELRSLSHNYRSRKRRNKKGVRSCLLTPFESGLAIIVWRQTFPLSPVS